MVVSDFVSLNEMYEFPYITIQLEKSPNSTYSDAPVLSNAEVDVCKKQSKIFTDGLYLSMVIWNLQSTNKRTLK